MVREESRPVADTVLQEGESLTEVIHVMGEPIPAGAEGDGEPPGKRKNDSPPSHKRP